jgi:hypothetical protein
MKSILGVRQLSISKGGSKLSRRRIMRRRRGLSQGIKINLKHMISRKMAIGLGKMMDTQRRKGLIKRLIKKEATGTKMNMMIPKILASLTSKSSTSLRSKLKS